MSSSLSEDDDLSALLILLPRGIESSEEVDPSADLAFALLKRGFFYIGKLTEKIFWTYLLDGVSWSDSSDSPSARSLILNK